MKILAIPASLRKGSLNRKLLAIASRVATESGVEVELIDLKNFSLPSYDGDIEAGPGISPAAQELCLRIVGATALMIASPEYNYSMPGHFKNTFDWLSRIRPTPWKGKPVLLMSASPSLVGGNRGLWALRVPFEACGAFVFPDMFSLSQADKAFDESGELVDPKSGERLAKNVEAFVAYGRALALEGK